MALALYGHYFSSYTQTRTCATIAAACWRGRLSRAASKMHAISGRTFRSARPTGMDPILQTSWAAA